MSVLQWQTFNISLLLVVFPGERHAPGIGEGARCQRKVCVLVSLKTRHRREKEKKKRKRNVKNQ
eukprot:6491070-Amphidinium_carterae.2